MATDHYYRPRQLLINATSSNPFTFHTFHKYAKSQIHSSIACILLIRDHVHRGNRKFVAPKLNSRFSNICKSFQELGFCVHVKYPHKIILVIMKMLDQSQNRELVQLSWDFMNDSLRSDVFMYYTPDQIGCACIWLSARIKKICLPENPPWYEIFDVTEQHCEAISSAILSLYCLIRPNAVKLERSINAAKEAYELKKSFNEKHKKTLKDSKKISTPNNFSPLDPSKMKDSPKKISPGDQLRRITKLASENGAVEVFKNGNRRKHHSPRRRYSPISPPRHRRSNDSRSNRKKHRSSSGSDAASPARKHKHRITSPRHAASSSEGSNDSDSSTNSEAARDEARKLRHEQRKKIASQRALQEKIRLLEKEKERNKKQKLKRDSGKEHDKMKHKAR